MTSICDGLGAVYDCGCLDIPEGECDCAGNVEDCNGDCGGNSVLSGCDNACNSTAYEDECGTCDDDALNDCVQDCAGVWGGNSVLSGCDNACNSTAYEDECGTCDDDASNDCVQDCTGTWGGSIADGDLNQSGIINVVDAVYLVNYILGDTFLDVACGDTNGDDLINISDVVAVVNIALDSRLHSFDDASNSKLIISENSLRLESDGFVQGIQIVLSHGSNFDIELTDALISEYLTDANKTTIIIATDGSHSITDIASFNGDIVVESVHVVNQSGDVVVEKVIELSSIKVRVIGPNPFNPSTKLSIAIPEAGFVSVDVYNLLGQKVVTLVDGYMEANTSGYIINFNASKLSSGVYLVQAIAAGDISTQKLMVIK